jgi:hypothetical protein
MGLPGVADDSVTLSMDNYHDVTLLSIYEIMYQAESHSSREIPDAFKIALMSITSTSSP